MGMQNNNVTTHNTYLCPENANLRAKSADVSTNDQHLGNNLVWFILYVMSGSPCKPEFEH